MEFRYQILRNFDAESLSNKLYSSLYGAVGDVDVLMLMGKWFTVIDSPRGGRLDRCTVAFYELLQKGFHTATFSVKQYSITNDELLSTVGYGRKYGNEAGELLINTGKQNDPCPYSIVRTGPINTNNQYDYVILSQPLKYPTVVLARDPLKFEKLYQAEVKEFLITNLYWKPVVTFGGELFIVNATSCILSNKYYYLGI
ncbi:unnamed protein product [Enterobius vermicularis]|uniref:DUF3504 domain-containing protein n=1 Tax=Enterobius vermicularis TaxID=51028 RepID=A0A0N4V4R9_ENTVE|nr:unnamed protein product [Enterobius vermicularis]